MNNALVQYLLYVTLVIYVSILEAVLYEFQCRMIFNEFLVDDEQKLNWLVILVEKVLCFPPEHQGIR